MTKLGLALSLLAFSTACASTPTFRRIEDPSVPFERSGFVIHPPEGPSWMVTDAKHGKRAFLAFAEDSAPPVEGSRIRPTTVIDITVIEDPETFRKEFPDQDQRAALEKMARVGSPPSTGRFKDVHAEFLWSAVKGQECIRVVRTVEETGNPIDPKAVLVNDARSTWLFHPTRPGTCMRVLVSHRAPKGKAALSVAELETSFFSKLEFE